jgi:transposase
VQIVLRVQRFRCRNHSCSRQVFTGQVDGVPSYLRQTSRLAEIVRVVGHAAGGLPGARLLARPAIRTSDDTVPRRVKASVAPGANDSIEFLGVDDLAWRKGQHYGTLSVGLDQRSVRDLLADRSIQSFRAWLEQQLRFRVISRDRGGIYAEGAELGFSAARRMADPLSSVFESFVERALEQHSREFWLRDRVPDQIKGEVEKSRTR